MNLRTPLHQDLEVRLGTFAKTVALAVAIAISATYLLVVPGNESSAFASVSPTTDAQSISAQEGTYYLGALVVTHPISGETLVAYPNGAGSSVFIAKLDNQGNPGTRFEVDAATLKPSGESYGVGNNQIILVPGASGRWMFAWKTATPMNVRVLGINVATNGSITRDAEPLIIEENINWSMISGAWGVSENAYLLSYPYRYIDPVDSSVETGLRLVSIKRNTADTGLEKAGENKVVNQQISNMSLTSTIDTANGWAVAYTDASGSRRALWATVSLSGPTVSVATQGEISSSASGETLHPQLVNTPSGIFAIFRYDSGVSNASDRFQVRGRWLSGTKQSATDDQFVSRAAAISRVRVAFSGDSLGLVWNDTHNYGSGSERVAFLNVPLDGIAEDPILYSPGSLIQLRPDIAWSSSLSRFVAVWVQSHSEPNTWSVWMGTTAYSSEGGSDSDTSPRLKPSNYFIAEGFKKGKAKLTKPMKSFIKKEITSRSDETRAVCTGTVRGKKWTAKKEALALARAKAGCDFVTSISPNLPVELKKRLIPKGKGDPLTVRIRVFY